MSIHHRHSMQFAVDFDYPVVFGQHLLRPENPMVRDILQTRSQQPVQRALAFIDAGLMAAQPELVGQLQDYFAAHGDVLELVAAPIEVAGGHR